MKRGVLCNVPGCGGSKPGDNWCNHAWSGIECPSCGYELIKNNVSGAVYCGACSHQHAHGALGKFIDLAKSV